MSIENQMPCCPYCGGNFEKSLNQGGYEKHRCKNCGYEFYIENEKSIEKLYALNAFCSEVIQLLHAKIDGGKEERITNWKNHERTLEKYIEKCGGESNQEPLFAIARAAHITDGFEQYFPKEEKTTVEALYNIAKEYADKNDKAINVKELMSLYRKKLRNKKRNMFLGILGGVLGVVLSGVVGASVMLYQYSPTLTDSVNGITISIPNDAISMLDKLNVDIHVEKQPTNTTAYIDAKNALHNETEKFELYDLSLKNGNKPLDFDGSVTVEIPIPEGYQPGALKIYHVISDEEFEEISSTISAAKNTISFSTTHFSYYAIAERHPIVVFDTDGAGEIDRQIVARDRLAQKPEDPQKTGYTFVGWKVGNESWDFSINTVKKDITLVAQWIPNEYTITLIANGGILSSDTLKISYQDTYASLPTDVVKDGFTFLGWYTAPENGVLITNDKVMETAADQTLYALFKENVNRITFHANGGSGEMNDLELQTGSSAKLPQNAFAKVGYTFVGWSTSVTGDAIYSDKAEYTMGTSSTNTLYAVWQINTNTLRFDANGGGGDMEAVSADYGTTRRLPANSFTRPGYTFIGWSTSQSGEIVYVDKAEYTMGEKNEYILYAQWQINVNKLHFEANGGNGSMDYLEADYNSFFRLPPNAFYRDGYTFIGWSTSPTGEKVYGDEAEYKMGADPDYTLYALWVGNQNAFVFHANGGTGNMPTDFTVATGTTKNLPQNQFIRNGYTFVGWSTDEYGTVKYVDGADYSIAEAGTVVLYAKWQLIDYTVSFETNGGNTISDKSYHAETDDFDLPIPTRIGYEFAGWYDNAELTGNIVQIVYQGSYGNKTYYAKWTLIDYEITYEANGGNYIDSKHYHIETPTFVLPTPVRTGYAFAGWYKNSDFTGDVITTVETGSYGSIELFAKWDLITYEIVFNVNGGADVSTITYTIESEGFTLPTPTKTGYEFIGWYKDDDFLTPTVDYVYQGSHGSMELYAKWVCVDYTITYESNEGSYISDKIYTIETETFTLPTPTRTGYSFVGWYANEMFDGSVIADVEKGSIGNRTLYAKWTPNDYTVTFNTNGGDDVADIVYNIETASFFLPTPVKTGYLFIGWYNDASFLGSVVDAVWQGTHTDMELHAKWTTVNYEITFESNNGTYISPITYHIESESVTLPNPVRNGYEFIGWYDNDEFNGNRIVVVSAGSIGNRKYYAMWSDAIDYSITFVPNGGSEVAQMYYNVETDTFELPTPTKTGYVFAGWYKNNTFTGSAVSTVYNGTHENMKLYAKWALQNYTVHHDTNGGDYIIDGNYNIESGYQLPTPIRTGYQFLAWYDNRSFTGEPVTEIKVGEIGDKTFHAAWEKNNYTVVYYPNDGVGTTPDSKHTYDVGQKLTKNGFTREHYIFAGWSLVQNGPVVYRDEEWVINLTPNPNGEINLYAKWTPITYYIYFETHGGATLEPLSYNIETSVMLPTTTRAGFIFDGWYETEDCSGMDTMSIPVGSYGDKTFHCTWQPAHFTITFYPNGGTMNQQTIQCTIDPNDPDKDNPYIYVDDIVRESPEWPTYKEYNMFLGWFNKKTGEAFDYDLEAWKTVSDPAVLENGLQLEARWSNLDVVYEGVANLKDPEVPEDGRVLYNLSIHTGNTACDRSITITNASEVIFLGNPAATYANLTINVNTTNEVTLVFVDFNMIGNIIGNSNNATIVCKGESSVTSTTTSKAAISGFADLTIEGDGNLSVTGANGADATSAGTNGTDGGTAIAIEQLTIDMAGKLSVIGGAGGAGAAGKNGTTTVAGGNGGNGGNGGMASECQTVLMINSNAIVEFIGGNGGCGGIGGRIPDGSNNDGMYNIADAGNGGNGGNGGTPILISTLKNMTCSSLELKYGDGGNGGDGGKGGNPAVLSNDYKPDQMSDGGNGGNGGNGFVAGNGGNGGKGGGAYGTDTWNHDPWIGRVGNGGDGGNGGNKISGVSYTSNFLKLLQTDENCGKGGSEGLKGDVLDPGEKNQGTTSGASDGNKGYDGSTDNSYYLDFVDIFNVS